MNLVRETRRSLYATVGAVTWAVDTLREIPDQMGRAWQDRDRWLHRADDTFDELAGRGQAVVGSAQEDVRLWARGARRAARRVPGVAAAEGQLAGLAGREGGLPIEAYDDLSASKISGKLPGLSQRELRQIEGYEKRNRALTTVLSRIEELRGEEPWPGYDEMTADEILPRIRAAFPDLQAAVADYEYGHKRRRTIMEAAHTHR